MRSIQVNIDKPNFTINPTNCSDFSVDSEGIGDQGTVADFSSFFHAVNCRYLNFNPKMTVKQIGKAQDTGRSSEPEDCASSCGPSPAKPTSSRSR